MSTAIEVGDRVRYRVRRLALGAGERPRGRRNRRGRSREYLALGTGVVCALDVRNPRYVIVDVARADGSPVRFDGIGLYAHEVTRLDGEGDT